MITQSTEGWGGEDGFSDTRNEASASAPEVAMTQSIETLAREIVAAYPYFEECDTNTRMAVGAVVAGIKLGREQAAGVADSMKYGDIAHDAETECFDDACNTIAQAIRALT